MQRAKPVQPLKALVSQKSANHHRHAECEQTCKNQVLKRRRRKPRAQDLSYCQCPQSRQRGRQCQKRGWRDPARCSGPGQAQGPQRTQTQIRRSLEQTRPCRDEQLEDRERRELQIRRWHHSRFQRPGQRPVRARIRTSHKESGRGTCRQPDDRVADEREPEQRSRNASIGVGNDAYREQCP